MPLHNSDIGISTNWTATMLVECYSYRYQNRNYIKQTWQGTVFFRQSMTRKYIMFRSTLHPIDAPCVGEVFGCPKFERLSEGRRHGSNWGELFWGAFMLQPPWWNKTPHGFQGLTLRNFLQCILPIKKGPSLWFMMIIDFSFTKAEFCWTAEVWV